MSGEETRAAANDGRARRRPPAFGGPPPSWRWIAAAAIVAVGATLAFVLPGATQPQPTRPPAGQGFEPGGPAIAPPADLLQGAPRAEERIPAPPEPRPAPPPRPVQQDVTQPPEPAQQNQTAPTQPALSQAEAELVLTLIRSTLAAVHHANETENYTVLRDLGAPGFREANSATKLAGIFAPIRQLGIDLAPALYLDPQLSQATLTQEGMLYLTGTLATRPVPVSFELLFQAVNNVWRLFGISLRPIQAQDSAPAGPPASGQIQDPPGEAAQGAEQEPR